MLNCVALVPLALALPTHVGLVPVGIPGGTLWVGPMILPPPATTGRIESYSIAVIKWQEKETRGKGREVG